VGYQRTEITSGLTAVLANLDQGLPGSATASSAISNREGTTNGPPGGFTGGPPSGDGTPPGR
jgi:hypothetical protein